MKKIYKMRKTVSMKQFLAEFGGEFPKHMKQRLLELGERCVLTRKDESFILDIKHVEHKKYKCDPRDENDTDQKEYAFGQFIVHEGSLNFSECCLENDDIMQSPVVNRIYQSLSSDELVLDGDIRGKTITEDNIDYIIDNILTVCPEVSAEHMAIISRY